MAIPTMPATFTKFPACLTGPFDEVELAGDTVDWEVELVAVIGARADRVVEADGWNHVAGLTVGQDLSERTVQFAAGKQYSLGQSFRGFGPMGPWLVTLDELDDPDDLAIGCALDGEKVQDARTGDLVFSIPAWWPSCRPSSRCSRGRHLHRHPVRGGRGPQAAPLSAGRPDAGELGGRHRHDAQPLRGPGRLTGPAEPRRRGRA